MIASDTSAYNFFRNLICPGTTVARTCFSPVTGAATSSLPCSTSSPWRGWPVSTRGRGPPEALARAPVWRHNSSGRRPRLPSCVRNSASRMPAWLRSQPTERAHYPPTERMAILELRAARGCPSSRCGVWPDDSHVGPVVQGRGLGAPSPRNLDAKEHRFAFLIRRTAPREPQIRRKIRFSPFRTA